MKITVSIPDSILRQADRLCQRLCVSRSELYARALEAYMKKRSAEEVTRRLNAVYGTVSSKLEPETELVSLEVHRRERW